QSSSNDGKASEHTNWQCLPQYKKWNEQIHTHDAMIRKVSMVEQQTGTTRATKTTRHASIHAHTHTHTQTPTVRAIVVKISQHQPHTPLQHIPPASPSSFSVSSSHHTCTQTCPALSHYRLTERGWIEDCQRVDEAGVDGKRTPVRARS